MKLPNSGIHRFKSFWDKQEMLTQEILKCSSTVISGQKSQSCLKLRKSQNPFCHILEILSKNYENKNCNNMFIQFYSASKFITVIVVKMLVHGHRLDKFHENYQNFQN